MKTLLIMRHAKSDYPPNVSDDFDRPLNKRGKRDAPTMASVVRAADLVPDCITCSPALRARETHSGLVEGGLNGSDPNFDERLYLADLDALWQVVSELPVTADTAMLVGHNPGLELLCVEISGSHIRLPTAGIVARIGPACTPLMVRFGGS